MGHFPIIDFIIKGDERGSLIALEENYNIPFAIKRVYYIFNTKKNVSRDFHAHINLKQLAICGKGSCTFIVDDGENKKYVELNTPNQGLLIEGLIWKEMHHFSEYCVLLLLACEHYDGSDYIRNYDEFKKEVVNAN